MREQKSGGSRDPKLMKYAGFRIFDLSKFFAAKVLIVGPIVAVVCRVTEPYLRSTTQSIESPPASPF